MCKNVSIIIFYALGFGRDFQKRLIKYAPLYSFKQKYKSSCWMFSRAKFKITQRILMKRVCKKT